MKGMLSRGLICIGCCFSLGVILVSQSGLCVVIVNEWFR
ncbi:unnamed protein product [Brassica napus]|uniref:(rape) hypothetical protein n=1 Tax=Brassica napus TaxID=3708 RepID=A0A816QFJ4_BRANA|nr:unnamed protein product [Brassica napus]